MFINKLSLDFKWKGSGKHRLFAKHERRKKYKYSLGNMPLAACLLE